MNLLRMDYFNVEAFELNFRLHTFGGFWPLDTNSKWKKVVFSVYSFLCFFSLTSMMAIQAALIYTLRHNPVKLTRDFSMTSVAIGITTKSVLILYKAEAINTLRRKFTQYKNSRTDVEDLEILQHSNKQILRVTRMFFFMGGPCSLAWILYPALDANSERRVPFPYMLPMKEWTMPVYVTIYVYHSLSMMAFLINILSVDSMFCGFLIRINAHYDVVIKNLKIMKKMRNVTSEIKEVVRDIARQHESILRDVDTVERIYGPSNLVHFGGIIPIIGIAIMDVVQISKGFRLLLLQKVLIVIVGLWDTYLYCFYASKMEEKSLELSFAVYDVPWYKMEPQVKKDLLFIISKTQKTPKIRVVKLFSLSIKTFVNILKISYDITALLFQTVQEE